MMKTALSAVIGRPPAALVNAALHQGLVESLVDDFSRRFTAACQLVDYHATRTGSLTVRLRAGHPYVAKLPLRESTGPRLRLNAQALRLLAQLDWMTPYLSERCPAPVLFGMASGHFYSVETCLPGQDGTTVLKTRAGVEELIGAAERFILKLQKASLVASEPDRSLWEADFENAVDRVERLAERAGAGSHYRQLVSAVRARLAAQPIPSVYSHGNFWLGNALFDSNNNLTGVIDWDCATPFALPVVDLIYLLVRTHSLVRGVSYGEGFTDWLESASLPLLDRTLVRHCQELSVPTDLVPTLAYCSWIQHLDAHCRFKTAPSTNARWLSRNVRQVLHRSRLQAATDPFGSKRWEKALES